MRNSEEELIELYSAIRIAMTLIARRYFIDGDVQGVGFRYFVLREVGRIGPIKGFVRNLRDGRVEVYAEGDESIVMQLEQSLRKGPRYSTVSNLVVMDENPDGRYADFRITS